MSTIRKKDCQKDLRADSVRYKEEGIKKGHNVKEQRFHVSILLGTKKSLLISQRCPKEPWWDSMIPLGAFKDTYCKCATSMLKKTFTTLI